MIGGERKHIVVLGAGFGGITAILKLYRRLRHHGLLAHYELIIVNKNPQHLYTPALYEIASIPKGEADAVCLKSSICIHIEDIIAPYPGIRFVGGRVKGLDPHARTITLESGEKLAFEYAVIALGSETNFFDIPGLEEYACPIKTFEDAVRLRNRVEALVASTSGALRIVVGGAGATGVELSAEFINFLCYMKEHVQTGKCQEEITLVEAGPEILSGFSHPIIKRARRRLETPGVKILTNSTIQSVTPGTIILTGGRTLPYHLLIWSGGVKPARVLSNFGLQSNAKGAIIVNEFLEARLPDGQAAPGIYAIGDCAGFINPKTGQLLPGNVPVAEAEGRLAAKNIAASILGQGQKSFRPMTHYPFILAVGGKYAITDLVIVKFSGFLGWVLKQLVELRYLLFILPWRKAWPMWLRSVYYGTRND